MFIEVPEDVWNDLTDTLRRADKALKAFTYAQVRMTIIEDALKAQRALTHKGNILHINEVSVEELTMEQLRRLNV